MNYYYFIKLSLLNFFKSLLAMITKIIQTGKIKKYNINNNQNIQFTRCLIVSTNSLTQLYLLINQNTKAAIIQNKKTIIGRHNKTIHHFFSLLHFFILSSICCSFIFYILKNKFIRDSRKSMYPYLLVLESYRKYQVCQNSGMGLCSCLNILYIFYWILPWNVSFSRLEKWEKYLIKDNFVPLIERKTTSNKTLMSR